MSANMKSHRTARNEAFIDDFIASYNTEPDSIITAVASYKDTGEEVRMFHSFQADMLVGIELECSTITTMREKLLLSAVPMNNAG